MSFVKPTDLPKRWEKRLHRMVAVERAQEVQDLGSTRIDREYISVFRLPGGILAIPRTSFGLENPQTKQFDDILPDRRHFIEIKR